MPPWLMGSLIAGAVCGLFPLSWGLKKGKIAVGIGEFFACVLASIILGLIMSIFVFNPDIYLGSP